LCLLTKLRTAEEELAVMEQEEELDRLLEEHEVSRLQEERKIQQARENLEQSRQACKGHIEGFRADSPEKHSPEAERLKRQMFDYIDSGAFDPEVFMQMMEEYALCLPDGETTSD
jgi:hypothetical protein